jgi:hypothetical protein
MEVNELRVGNLVRANCIYEGQVKTFKRLNETLDVLFFSDGNKWETGEFLSDCDPVELTEEWLTNLGFEETYNGLFDKIPSRGFHYSTKTNRVTTTKYNQWLEIEIKYVHQLQNLYFALRGEELQLNKSV